MYQLHGFMVINGLIDNELNQVSPLGELSPKSRSYSREIGIYSHPDYDTVRLLTFFSQNEETAEPLAVEKANELLAFGAWFANQSLTNQLDENRRAVVQLLNAEYAGRMTFLQVGKMVQSGDYWMPEYVTFTLASDSRKNRYKIWFADKAFRAQYDKYEIEVIPPIVTVDDFHKGVDKVKQVLTDHTLEELHGRVNKKANEKPYTYILTNQYNYINPNDSNEKIKTHWTVIIYGEAGKNADVIREKIAAYVLANSDYTQQDWERIMPDLFIPTEFYICPVWTKFATENKQVQGGIYSPVLPYRELLPFAQRTMFGYKPEKLTEHMVTFGTIFKSIAVVACGHERNNLVSPKFEEVWPEYCNIYTTSRDFNRISPETQEFILFMNTLLVEAETLTPDGETQQEFTRVIRGNFHYVTGRHRNVTYLVPLRWNFLNEMGTSPGNSLVLPTVNPIGSNTGRLTEEGDERSRDVIDLTPSVGKDPSYRRGRPTIGVEPVTRPEDGIITNERTQDSDGLTGTKNDGIDETPAASRTASNPRNTVPNREHP